MLFTRKVALKDRGVERAKTKKNNNYFPRWEFDVEFT